MARPNKTRIARAALLLNAMPHVPELVKSRFRTAFLQEDPSPRGMPKALDKFYAHLKSVSRTPNQLTPEDFRSLAASRTAHRTLLAALRQYAPEVPVAAARPVSQMWDNWLNTRYNQKAKKPRNSTRVAFAHIDWPDTWKSGTSALDQAVRIKGRWYRPLAPKTRENIIQAVGMLATARNWAQKRDVVLDERFSPELFDAFARFMLLEREVSARTVADYLERVEMFAKRADLLEPAGVRTLSELIGALREDASEAEPGKRAKIRAFRDRFSLRDLLDRAQSLTDEADAAPDGTAEAERKRRSALILALFVNTGDRQGDLSRLTIGEQVTRNKDGVWEIQLHQAKTGRKKELGALWPLTCALIDAHILAGRPAWQIKGQVHALSGCNLLSLSNMPFHTYFSANVLRQEFGISGHLMRTLITDLLRNARSDAAWAAQEMLGHSNKWMQATYQSDFRAVASIRQWHALLKIP